MFHTVLEYLCTYSKLYIPGHSDTLVIYLIFINDYGSWGKYAKASGMLWPSGFYYKGFPYSSNRYSLFEKLTWTLCKAIHNLNFLVRDHCLIILTLVPLIKWIQTPGEQLQGVLMEPEVLQWKWYLQNALEETPINCSWSPGRLTEEITAIPLIPVPVHPKDPLPNREHTTRQAILVHCWVLCYYQWEAALESCTYRPSDTHVLTSQVVDASALVAEFMVVKLVIDYCISKNGKFI